jgi:hypothetical protein
MFKTKIFTKIAKACGLGVKEKPLQEKNLLPILNNGTSHIKREQHDNAEREGNTLRVDDLIKLQKNNIMWGNETNYEIWKKKDDDNEMANKFIKYNRTREKINIVVAKPEDTQILKEEKEIGNAIPAEPRAQEEPQIQEKK